MFEELAKRGSKWLDNNGPESDIVISSRIRLARNIHGYCFPHIIRPEEYENLFLEIKKAVKESKILKTTVFVDINEAAKLDRIVLMERHIISYDHVISERNRSVFFSKDEQISLMVNEEDHIRMQVIQSGIQLKTCWQIINKLDDELEKNLIYSFSNTIGFLAACPTNTGTGLRASAMVHLPALVMNKDIGKVLQGVSQLGLVVRGFYGEGVDINTAFYQISNQISLGQTEEEIVGNIEGITKQIAGYEQKARNTLFKNSKVKMEDNIWRAYGVLKNVRAITFEEAISLLSALRLGVETGIIDINIKVINELLIITQPGHIQKLFGRDMPEEERDTRRAELVRSKLKEGEKKNVS
jgi:protein arginine kinase